MAYIGANPQTSLQQYLTIDDISGSFNGVLTSFALQVGGVAPVPGPSQSNQLLISLGGVIQEPDDTGSAGFRLSGGNIIFSSAPASSTAFFGVVLAGADYIYAGTNFPDGSVTTPSITFANDLDSGFYRAGSGELAYTSNGTFRLKIDSSGRLGVGTSSPDTSFKLTIQGNRSAVGPGILFTDADASPNNYAVYINGSKNFTIRDQTSAADRLTITSAGNVGVGTTSPSALLHVAGANSAGMAIFEDTAGTNKIGKIFGYAGGLYLQSRNDTNYGEIVFRAENSGGTAERMRIDSSGRVGIGTNSPSRVLQVKAPSANSAHIALIDNDSTNEIWQVGNQADGDGFMSLRTDEGTTTVQFDASGINYINGGNVGIGTTSPSSALQVNGIIRAQRSDDSNPRYTQISFEGGISSLDSVRNDSQFEAIRFRQSADNGSNYTERMRIDSSGQVGIGTTSSAVGRVGILANTNAEALSLISRPSDDQCELHFRNSADNATLARISTSGGQNFAVRTGTSEAFRVDSSQRLLIGYSSSIGIDSKLQIASAGSSNRPALEMLHYENADGASQLTFTKSRGTTIGSSGAVTGNDDLGGIYFRGDFGAGTGYAAHIRAEADGAFSTSNYPGRLVFSTTSASAASSTERARFTQDGFFKASNTGTYQGASGYHEFRTSNNDQGLYLHATHASYSENLILGRATRGATSAYRFILFQSGNGADTEYNLQGDGNAFADGTWTGGGADYAEYFEWSDGNATAEDRRGISVVLDGDKIREATAGEEPIGVISGNPSVVGDAAWNKWSGKHLRDEFGSYLLDAKGYRQLNPDYDPDQEYISREERPEWDCVGLMGKLRIRKGQVTGARWIKMRDVSDNVEEWLVR